MQSGLRAVRRIRSNESTPTPSPGNSPKSSAKKASGSEKRAGGDGPQGPPKGLPRAPRSSKVPKRVPITGPAAHIHQANEDDFNKKVKGRN